MARRAATPAPTATEEVLSSEDISTLGALLRKLIGTPGGAAPAAPEEPTDPATDDDGLGLDDPEEPAEPAVTLDDVRNKLKEVIAAKGRETAAKILAKFGADALPKLDAENYEAAIALADKVLAKK